MAVAAEVVVSAAVEVEEVDSVEVSNKAHLLLLSKLLLFHTPVKVKSSPWLMETEFLFWQE